MIRKYSNKERMSLSLIELMQTRTLDKISVQMIVDNCDLTRQTFYYHFRDKYDLVHWIFRKVVDDVADGSDLNRPWNLVLGDMLSAMKEHRRFYENAINYIDQNSLSEFMREYTRTAYARVLQERVEEGCLSEDLLFSIHFNSYGAVGTMIDWIVGGMKEEPYHLAERIAENMPEGMKSYFRTENQEEKR